MITIIITGPHQIDGFLMMMMMMMIIIISEAPRVGGAP